MFARTTPEQKLKLVNAVKCMGLLVAMTGYGSDVDRVAALDAGFDTHLTKPVTIATVERLIETNHRRLTAARDGRVAPV